MPQKTITVIPATEPSLRQQSFKKLRVAAYCRVSTEDEEQQGSFETQKAYYTDKILAEPTWTLVDIYADHGISGVHTKKREGFIRMISDCKKKRIDLILTKSISRFARNTVDSVQYVRLLRQLGISVIFEKENIDTGTMTSEMILTVLSAHAQAESESISQNVARGKRMGFRQGHFAFPYSQLLGYHKGADGRPEIIPEEAEIIRMIFNSYLQGDSLKQISQKLEAAKILTSRGNSKWSSQTILRILQNEKYCGDVLLQKTFTENVLSGTVRKNTGQLPQYYIENNHEGIVTKQIFREVQAEITRRNSKPQANRRKSRRGRYNSKYPLSERLICGQCGSPYKRVTWNIHGRKQIVWRCVSRVTYGPKFCKDSPSIPEEQLHQAIVTAIQTLSENYATEVANDLNNIVETIETSNANQHDLQLQLEQTQAEFDHLFELSLECDERVNFLDVKLKNLSEQIQQLQSQMSLSHHEVPLTHKFSQQDLQIDTYSDDLVVRLIDHIIVLSKDEIEIHFLGGYNIVESLRFDL